MKPSVTIITITSLLLSLAACRDTSENPGHIKWIVDSLPDSEVDEIYIDAISTILNDQHVDYQNNIAIAVELTKQQREFIEQTHPNTLFIRTDDYTVSNKSRVQINARWPSSLDSGKLTLRCQYYCGTTCMYSWQFVYKRYKERWIRIKSALTGLS